MQKMRERENEEPTVEYLAEELLPVKLELTLRLLYFHECKVMECRVITDNKEPCRFCGTEEWEQYVI